MKRIFFVYFFIYLFLISLPQTVLAQFSGSPQPAYFGVVDVDTIFDFFNWLLGGIGIISLFGFFIAVILYATAAGDEDRVAQGGRTFFYSLAGIVIYIAGYFLLKYVQNLLMPASV